MHVDDDELAEYLPALQAKQKDALEAPEGKEWTPMREGAENEKTQSLQRDTCGSLFGNSETCFRYK